MIALFRFLSILPLAWLHGLGSLFGWLTWLFSPLYRQHMRENMRLALGEGVEKPQGMDFAEEVASMTKA